MDLVVLVSVLAAAVLHATWNALVKAGGDPFARLAIVNLVGGVCALSLLPWARWPASGAWPWLAGSACAHLAYYGLLCRGYVRGDLSRVYPIARGTAPPLVALGAIAFAGERLDAFAWLAIALVCAGIWLVARTRRAEPGAVGAAMLTGVAIAGYSVCDGLGARAAGDVPAYVAILFFVNALPFGLVVLVLRSRIAARARVALVPATIGGVLSFAGYAIVIWAMTRAPLAAVASVRETSVVIAAYLGVRVLGEDGGLRRVAAAVLVAAGVAVLQFARSTA